MLWSFADYRLGDITIIRVGGVYHLFSELFPLQVDDPAGVRIVGHARSHDLVHWEELQPAIGCGPPGSFDAFCIFHMDVFVHEGVWYMFYTGLDKVGPGQKQSIGLATSRDGLSWQKHPDNPLVEADLRYYEQAIPREATYQEKDFGRLWFRDPFIVRDPATGRFGMIVIARDRQAHPDVRACLAWAESDDLVHWTTHPPIYSPGRFHTLETPSMFEHEGRWFLMFMVHPAWGFPPVTTDGSQNAGYIYAISDDGPRGPFRQPRDEIVVAASDYIRFGAQRTIETADGRRYLYGWLNTRARGSDPAVTQRHDKFLPTLKPLTVTDEGDLHAMYDPAIEAGAAELLAPAQPLPIASAEPVHWSVNGGTAHGKHAGAATTAMLTVTADALVYSARIDLGVGERAGLLFRADVNGRSGLQAVVDKRFGRVELGVLGEAGFIDARSWAGGDAVTLKVVAEQMSIEVYADDRLMIHQVRHRERGEHVGLIAERAAASFSQVRLLRLGRSG